MDPRSEDQSAHPPRAANLQPAHILVAAALPGARPAYRRTDCVHDPTDAARREALPRRR